MHLIISFYSSFLAAEFVKALLPHTGPPGNKECKSNVWISNESPEQSEAFRSIAAGSLPALSTPLPRGLPCNGSCLYELCPRKLRLLGLGGQGGRDGERQRREERERGRKKGQMEGRMEVWEEDERMSGRQEGGWHLTVIRKEGEFPSLCL